MGRLTVDQIMQQIAATVNQESAAPTSGGDEWSLWLAYMNRAVEEWAQANDWEDLRKTFFPAITGAATATIALPNDFWKLAKYPINYSSGLSMGEEWPEILPENEGSYNITEKWVQVWGNINTGHNLIWNPGSLVSGASIAIQYFSIPTSLASPANIPVLPDSQFIVDRTVAFILEARSDPRFQQQETKAREKLLQMIENANMSKYTGYAGTTPIPNALRKRGFRMGRD